MNPVRQEEILIQDACRGLQGAVERLAQAARPRLCAYLLRLTMDYDLTEDLTQETLLEMVKSLPALREPEKFWPWLFRIALSKAQFHWRKQHRRQSVETSYRQFLRQLAENGSQEAFGGLLQSELSHSVLAAINQLDPNHRAILSLRCFEQLSYGDISHSLQTSETNARILFFRAKQALKKQLAHAGIGKKSLLMSLAFFARLTKPAEAAAPTVAAASLKVSASTAILAACGTKGVAIIAAAGLAASTMITTVAVQHYKQANPYNLPDRNAVTSVHFTVQGRNNTPGAPSSFSKGAYQQWFYFPAGPDGPVFMRMQRWDPLQTNSLCAWLQNQQANYYHHSGSKTLYIQNYRLWSRSTTQLLVRRLPSDDTDFCAFLDEVEGARPGLIDYRDRKTQMLAQAVDRRFVDVPDFQVQYEYNTLGADFFQNNWPTDTPVIDQRDQMRKRGWTFFQIEGRLGELPIVGKGRLPFFYDSSLIQPAWMHLEIAGKLTIIDTQNGAFLLDRTGLPIARYAPGHFFKGLPRPWMGMHTIDIIRRDAAAERIPFDTIQLSDYGRTGNDEDYFADAKVICTDKTDRTATALEYIVDMDGDLLTSLKIQVFDHTGQTSRAELNFTYLQELPESQEAFTEPVPPAQDLTVLPDNGIHWLIDLAADTLCQ